MTPHTLFMYYIHEYVMAYKLSTYLKYTNASVNTLHGALSQVVYLASRHWSETELHTNTKQ
jgi:hypothetical protein